MDDWRDSLSLKVLRCEQCKHLWHADCPDQDTLFTMYAAAGRHKNINISGRDAIPRPVRRHLRALSRLSPRQTNKAIQFLDYGSGYGLWAQAAKEMGFDVTGYEPAASNRGMGAHSTVALRIIGDLNELDRQGYDVINLEQVLEHVPHPIETLRGLRNLAAPGGIIRMSVPDVRGGYDPSFWEAFPYGGRKHILSPYEHLQGFNQMSLREAMGRADLEEIGWTRLLCADFRLGARRMLAPFAPYLRSTTLFARFSDAAAAAQ